ncbi:Transcription activator AMTR1 [Colletotrichum orbiculare MAFF 240422]|uniref:Transcription activator AMTR1 n=1 Tax=Colletotrichum orbiculare (strain 104-T / ATCC 96160 / CBS 514.97 / LARS 414 / MAFF 240422) TaxID=1213857 RepID=A0A484FJ88_COLOR|nr:Transcription activator AMTR1 [Colletotrichum orbiculare MAFF 240422]
MGSGDEEPPRYFTRGRLTRGRGLRNTTGCVTCRRRHVKCDEKRPVCGGCERTKHDCVYVPRRPPQRKRASNEDATATPAASIRATPYESRPDVSHTPRSPQQQTPVTGTSCDQASWPASPVREQQRPTTASTVIPLEADPNDQDPASFSPGDIAAVQQESPGQDVGVGTGFTPNTSALTSSSFGANLENATAIWVDLLLQDAAMQEFDFTNLNIDTEGMGIFGSSVVQSPAVRAPVKLAGNSSSPTPKTSNPYLQERTPELSEYQRFEKKSWHSQTPIHIQPQEHIIFQNFVRRVSQWMDLFDPKRPFGTHVPQLAMHNVGLMNAILALSSRHISLSTKQCDGDPNDTLRYYYKTLHYIQEAMQYDSYKTSLELLATCSIVSAYEMLDGSRQDWERHLKGVFWIQRSQVIHGDSSGLKQAVWWAWLCQDVWAAFREKRRPFTFWRPLRTLDELDPYELAARSVYFFAQVVAFCSREDTEAGKNDPLGRIASADALKDTLETWRRHLTAEFQPLPYPTSKEEVFEPIWIHSPVFAVAFQTYYCAHILLLMNSPIIGGLDQYTQQRKRLIECVSKVCGIALTLSDYPSSVMCSQCLYIAGIPLESKRERECVLSLLEACRERSGWPVKPLGEELKSRWEEASETP